MFKHKKVKGIIGLVNKTYQDLQRAECFKFVHRYYLNALGGPLQLVVVLVGPPMITVLK